MAVVWKMLMVAESRFRRLRSPELMKNVHLGAEYVNGNAVKPVVEKVAACSRLHIY